ncbi:MAG: hypothetical protein HZB23_05675 [Deltaproteobacteria bacterium]|nr:hypothetical protein [Deltaproteobacteria bacterium]
MLKKIWGALLYKDMNFLPHMDIVAKGKVKSTKARHPGVGRGPEKGAQGKKLDSGLRRNDGLQGFSGLMWPVLQC